MPRKTRQQPPPLATGETPDQTIASQPYESGQGPSQDVQTAPPSGPTEPPDEPGQLQLKPEDLTKWRDEVTRAQRRRQVYEAAWTANLKDYTPDYVSNTWGDEINPGKVFYQTEQKKAQLFFDTPEIVLSAPPGPAGDPKLQEAIAVEQAALNKELGRERINAKRLVDKVLFDLLCPAGEGCSKIGITRITKPMPMPPDPTTGQAPMGPDGQPQTVDVPIYQELFWERFSPMKMLKPAGFHDTEWDKAPWLGVEFALPLPLAKRQFNLPDDFSVTTAKDERIFKSPGNESDDASDLVTGQEIWLKAAFYDETVLHPQMFRQLVLVDGMDKPAVYRDSPYQFKDENGGLTPDSLIGNPIHPCTVRDLSDQAFIPSDTMVTRPLIRELAKFRTQLIEHRDASIPVRFCREGTITNEILSKIVRAPFGSIIPLPDEEYSKPGDPVKIMSPGAYSRDNFQSQEVIERDIEKQLALGGNQTGAKQQTGTTATETTLIDRATSIRMKAERNRVLEWFLAGVRKLDALRQHFQDQPSAAMGRYGYEIKPDSGVHVDEAEERKNALDAYNFLAKAPIDHLALLRELLPKLHLDPSLVQPPPPAVPESPKISVIIRGEDLNPFMPQYGNVALLLAKANIQLPPAAPMNGLQPPGQPGQPPMMAGGAPGLPPTGPPPHGPITHGGMAPTADLVNKHQADESGQPQGLGGLARRPM